jgi:hypothetical protein
MRASVADILIAAPSYRTLNPYAEGGSVSSGFAASQPVAPPAWKWCIAWRLQKNHAPDLLAFRKDIFSYKEPDYWFTIVSNRAGCL